ncbi:unnamed protein product [Owenia fusiformis]|uniref:Uncharacterized protein n=1 Tax=Owenia fusiformis TaxID=6347 RepID=A0A8J1TYD7_OWEFU|nr:unnamed protein product [Owenia fusiformis]
MDLELQWVLEFACANRYHSVIAEHIKKNPGCDVDIRMACCSIHRIMTRLEFDELPLVMSLIEEIYNRVDKVVTCTHFAKIISGLKIMILFHTLQQDDPYMLARLNEFFPRDGWSHPKANPTLSKKLNKEYLRFRKFFLPLITDKKSHSAHIKDEFATQTSTQTLVTKFLEAVEHLLPKTVIEKINEEDDEILDIITQHHGSVDLEHFMDKLLSIGTRDEASVLEVYRSIQAHKIRTTAKVPKVMSVKPIRSDVRLGSSDVSHAQSDVSLGQLKVKPTRIKGKYNQYDNTIKSRSVGNISGLSVRSDSTTRTSSNVNNVGMNERTKAIDEQQFQVNLDDDEPFEIRLEDISIVPYIHTPTACKNVPKASFVEKPIETDIFSDVDLEIIENSPDNSVTVERSKFYGSMQQNSETVTLKATEKLKRKFKFKKISVKKRPRLEQTEQSVNLIVSGKPSPIKSRILKLGDSELDPDYATQPSQQSSHSDSNSDSYLKENSPNSKSSESSPHCLEIIPPVNDKDLSSTGHVIGCKESKPSSDIPSKIDISKSQDTNHNQKHTTQAEMQLGHGGIMSQNRSPRAKIYRQISKFNLTKSPEEAWSTEQEQDLKVNQSSKLGKRKDGNDMPTAENLMCTTTDSGPSSGSSESTSILRLTHARKELNKEEQSNQSITNTQCDPAELSHRSPPLFDTSNEFDQSGDRLLNESILQNLDGSIASKNNKLPTHDTPKYGCNKCGKDVINKVGDQNIDDTQIAVISSSSEEITLSQGLMLLDSQSEHIHEEQLSQNMVNQDKERYSRPRREKLSKTKSQDSQKSQSDSNLERQSNSECRKTNPESQKSSSKSQRSNSESQKSNVSTSENDEDFCTCVSSTHADDRGLGSDEETIYHSVSGQSGQTVVSNSFNSEPGSQQPTDRLAYLQQISEEISDKLNRSSQFVETTKMTRPSHSHRHCSVVLTRDVTLNIEDRDKIFHIYH